MTFITSLLGRGVASVKALACKPYHWYLNKQDEKIARVFIQNLSALEFEEIGPGLASKLTDLLNKFPKRLSKTNALEVRRHNIAENARAGRKVQAANAEQHEQLLVKAIEFKNKENYIEDKKLTKNDQDKIDVALNNADFTQLLLDDEQWRYEFFHWIIVNDGTDTPFTANDPNIMIKFPGLFKNYLRKFTGRSSRFGARLFRITDKQTLEAKVEGVYRTFGPEFVTNGYNQKGKKTTTLQKIFDEVKGKIYTGNGDFEVINENGFSLINCREGGVYHEDRPEDDRYIRLDLTQKDWLQQLPTIEVMTDDDISDRFHIESEKTKYGEQGYIGDYDGFNSSAKPVVVLTATRKGPLEFRGTHGFTRLLIPTENPYRYELKSMGVFTDWFPQGFFETFSFMPQFHRARVMIFDENEVNNERTYASWPITPAPSPNAWNGFIASMKKDIQRGWDGTLEFHTGLRNCTTRVWAKMKNHFGKASVPDLKVTFWQMRPGNIEGKVMRFVEKFPFFVGYVFMHLLFFVFGSWRTFQAAKKTTYVENGIVHTKDNLRTVSMVRSWWNGDDVFGRNRPFLIHPAPLFDAVHQRNVEIEAL